MILRARFHSDVNDPRPVVWPIKYPYWISGSGEDHSTLIAYVDSEAQLLEYWPDATNIDIDERECITFTSRFSKPDWFDESSTEIPVESVGV